MLQSMRIHGGIPLCGEVEISGAKNLALPALVTTLLTDKAMSFKNIPNLADIASMLGLLEFLGCDINHCPMRHRIELRTENLVSVEAPYDFVRKMRASILVLSPLVARFKKASVSLPGGCAIGVRNVDLHLKTLQQLGAVVSIEDGQINASAPYGLKGAEISFPFVTVTGTENAMMAACLAQGRTILHNVALEPEVSALADLLNLMGAKIAWQGARDLVIDGVDALHGAEFEIIPDRIEAGTYAIAAAASNGKVRLKHCNERHLDYFFDILRSSGIAVVSHAEYTEISRDSDVINPKDIDTAPYPGFPTDLQAQYSVLMALSSGTACIRENIFENRFMHIPELCRMGANIQVHGNTAIIHGVSSLTGAQVMATDLRASVALVIAGLSAHGETVVNRLYHIDRGYEAIDEKLRSLGAHVERFAA